jgi:non-canonical (house-cleaning) NTP pyrophosphatase
LSGEKDVRSKQGMIGIITNGFVDRTEEYTGITKMALGLWYGRKVADLL